MNALQRCLDSFHTNVTAEALRAKIDDFAPMRSLWSKISGTRGHPPPIIFARLVTPTNALQLCLWQFHTKELCSRLSSSEVRFFTQIGSFAFLRPPLGDLGATYDDHLTLIGKRVEVFLLALIVLFSLDVTAEALRAIIGSKSAILLQRGPVDPKFQVEGVAPPPTILLLRKLGWIIFHTVYKFGQIFLPFCHNSRVWQTDRRTDRQTDRQNSHR